MFDKVIFYFFLSSNFQTPIDKGNIRAPDKTSKDKNNNQDKNVKLFIQPMVSGGTKSYCDPRVQKFGDSFSRLGSRTNESKLDQFRDFRSF